MNRTLALGVILTGLGVLGYSVGIAIAYPGRAFSVTAVIIGVATLAVGFGNNGDSA